MNSSSPARTPSAVGVFEPKREVRLQISQLFRCSKEIDPTQCVTHPRRPVFAAGEGMS
jgi:hypothetical protein